MPLPYTWMSLKDTWQTNDIYQKKKSSDLIIKSLSIKMFKTLMLIMVKGFENFPVALQVSCVNPLELYKIF